MTRLFVTVSYEEFIRGLIHHRHRGASEVFMTIAAIGPADFADLQNKASVAGELQHHVIVVFIVTGKPNAILFVEKMPCSLLGKSRSAPDPPHACSRFPA